jgi:predicted nucleotidyltransferase
MVESEIESLDRQRLSHAAALEHGLGELVRQLRAIPEVAWVILFGSYARGQRDLLTDLDLVVVMESPLDFVSRTADLAGRVHAGVPLDLLVYTPDEWVSMQGRPFYRHALATSKVLYARDAA